MHKYNLVGKANTRYDSFPKADGSLPYGEDFIPEGALHCGVLFSPVPCGKLRKIDISKAEKLKGVAAIITSKNIPGINNRYGSGAPGHRFQPVLIDEKIEYIGDAIAIVGAESREILKEALSLVEIEIESLHGIWSTKHNEKSSAERCVCDFSVKRGEDLKKVFSTADVIVEKKYQTQFAEHAFIEPASGSSWIEEDGVITIRVGTQLIENYRAIATILGIPQSRVRHLGTYVGGGFGAKGMLTVEPYLALLTWLTKRPSTMVLGREEGIRHTVKKHPFEMHYKTAASKDGKILGVQAKIIADAGAYPYKSDLILLGTVCIAAGPYNIPNLEVRCRGFLTNNPITNAMRGVGSNQVCFAYENQMNLVANALKMNPSELRKKNFIQKGDRLANGQEIKYRPNLEECLESALNALGKSSKPSCPNKKIGRAVAANITGYGRPFDGAEASILMESDGSVIVRVSAPDIGAGQGATIQTITAEVLGLRLDQVSTRLSDSANTPFSGITAGSRQTMMAGLAVKNAAQEIKKSLLKAASNLLEASQDDIQFSNGEAWVLSAPKHRISIPVIAKKVKDLGESLHCTHGADIPVDDGDFAGRYMGGMPKTAEFTDYTFGVHASEVEVDIETGEVSLLKHIATHEVGRAINPVSVEGQFEGGSVMGIGYALHEKVAVDKGNCDSQNFHEYLIPTSQDIGEFQSVILECGEGAGPFGAKGVGEPPCNNAPASVAIAVSNAIEMEILELPITPESVLNAIQRT